MFIPSPLYLLEWADHVWSLTVWSGPRCSLTTNNPTGDVIRITPGALASDLQILCRLHADVYSIGNSIGSGLKEQQFYTHLQKRFIVCFVDRRKHHRRFTRVLNRCDIFSHPIVSVLRTDFFSSLSLYEKYGFCFWHRTNSGLFSMLVDLGSRAVVSCKARTGR